MSLHFTGLSNEYEEYLINGEIKGLPKNKHQGNNSRKQTKIQLKKLEFLI